MNLEDFVLELTNSIDCFEVNLVKLNVPPRTKAEWMTTLLLWLEWETDAHNEYWSE